MRIRTALPVGVVAAACAAPARAAETPEDLARKALGSVGLPREARARVRRA